MHVYIISCCINHKLHKSSYVSFWFVDKLFLSKIVSVLVINIIPKGATYTQRGQSLFDVAFKRFVNLIFHRDILNFWTMTYWPKVFEEILLKYGSEEKGSWFYKCSILLGFETSKKQERLSSELLSEDKITNLLGFLTW